MPTCRYYFRMPKNDPIQSALDRLGELRRAEPSARVIEEVRGFLRSRSNLVVAKAAKVVVELRLSAMLPEVVAAFHKLIGDAPRLDKRCAAVTELASALYELDYDEPSPYLKGIKHVQMEASYGPPVDEAAKLRAVCARGLLRTRYPERIAEVVQLLVDREPTARSGAVRALASNGGEAGAWLLRLKVLTGDQEAEVLGECFAGLLAAAPDKSVPFVASFVDSADEAVAEAAMFALGESRLCPAFEALEDKWNRTLTGQTRRTLLSAMAASRLDQAVTFLTSLVEDGSRQIATYTIEALAIYRSNDRVKQTIHDALLRRDDNFLLQFFDREFEKPGG